MTVTKQKKAITYADWHAKGLELFGPDEMSWRFVCPCCQHVQTPHDYKNAGAPEGAVAFSCVGRWSGVKREAFGQGPGPCNYAGGGLFGLNPVSLTMPDGKPRPIFEFAESVERKDGAK